MKNPFKKGDRVKRKNPNLKYRYGIVTDVNSTREFSVFVTWDTTFSPRSWYTPEELDFAETPIERMKRRYSEEEE